MTIYNFRLPQRERISNRVYQIDIAFIISDHYLGLGSLSYWDSEIKSNYIPAINDVYQNSGVNVEFRAVAVRPFSEYRSYLLCDLSSLDNLSFKESTIQGGGQLAVLTGVGT